MGRLVDIFPGEILGTEQEMIEAVMVGALDIQLSGGVPCKTLFLNLPRPTSICGSQFRRSICAYSMGLGVTN